MSLLTMIIGRDKRTQIIRTDTTTQKKTVIALDVMEKEIHKGEAEATQFPIELSSPGSDYMILKSRTLQIDGIVSASPMTLGASIQGGVTTVASQIGNAVGGGLIGAASGIAGGLAGKSLAGLIDQSGPDRLPSVVKELEAARKTRLPINIQTGLLLYQNYLLTSYSIERNKSTGKSIRISLSFIELVTVSSQIVSKIPSIKKAVPQKNSGVQKTQPLSDNQEGAASLLVKALGL